MTRNLTFKPSISLLLGQGTQVLKVRWPATSANRNNHWLLVRHCWGQLRTWLTPRPLVQPGGRTSVIIHNIDSAGKTHTLLLGPASLRQQGNNTLHKYSKTNTLLSKYSMTTQHFSATTFLLFSLLNSPQILQANIFFSPPTKNTATYFFICF